MQLSDRSSLSVVLCAVDKLEMGSAAKVGNDSLDCIQVALRCTNGPSGHAIDGKGNVRPSSKDVDEHAEERAKHLLTARRCIILVLVPEVFTHRIAVVADGFGQTGFLYHLGNQAGLTEVQMAVLALHVDAEKRLHGVTLRYDVPGLQDRAEFFNQLRVCRRNGEVVHMCAEEDLFPGFSVDLVEETVIQGRSSVPVAHQEGRNRIVEQPR